MNKWKLGESYLIAGTFIRNAFDGNSDISSFYSRFAFWFHICEKLLNWKGLISNPLLSSKGNQSSITPPGANFAAKIGMETCPKTWTN